MQLSQRTLIRRNEWCELIRALPEGENPLPRLSPTQWDTLKTTCYRENKKGERYYQPSNKKGQINIIVKSI